jgi:hypothetical protein
MAFLLFSQTILQLICQLLIILLSTLTMVRKIDITLFVIYKALLPILYEVVASFI